MGFPIKLKDGSTVVAELTVNPKEISAEEMKILREYLQHVRDTARSIPSKQDAMRKSRKARNRRRYALGK